MDSTQGDRLRQLERTLEHQATLIGLMADMLEGVSERVFALQHLLEDKAIVTRQAVTDRMRALNEATTFEVEFAPKHREFRQARRIAQSGEIAEPDE